jgi:hypothetical protein
VDRPLTVARLRELLLDDERALVSLDGERADETYVLEHRGAGWLVFFWGAVRSTASASTARRMPPVVICWDGLAVDVGLADKIGSERTDANSRCHAADRATLQARSWDHDRA